MEVEWCEQCKGWVLVGQRKAYHLRSSISEPAHCDGFDPGVATTHLSHPAEWRPPHEHMNIYERVPQEKRQYLDKVHEGGRYLPPAPQEYCTCGYYVVWNLEDASHNGVWTVPAYVLGIGKYVAYTKGARVERFLVLRWWWPRGWAHKEPVPANELWWARSCPFLWSSASPPTPITCKDIVNELAEALRQLPQLDDPQVVKLPTGILPEMPDVVAAMLEERGQSWPAGGLVTP